MIRKPPLFPFALGFLVYFIFLGVAAPYWSVYLEEVVGLTEGEVGTVLLLYLLSIITGSFVSGRLSDTFHSRLKVQRATSFCAVVICIAWIFVRGLPMAIPMAMALGLSIGGQVPMMDASAVQALGARRHLYSRVRLWGTLGFGISAFSLGWVRSGHPEFIMIAMAIGMAAFHTLTWWLPDSQPKGSPPRFRDFQRLLKSPSMLLVLGSTMIYTIAYAPREMFGSIHFRSLGFSEPRIGTFYAVAMTSEIAAFALLPRILARVRPLILVMVAVAVTGTRWALLSQATTAGEVFALEALHALTYGAWWGAMIQILVTIVPESLRTTGQALISMAFGTGMGLGAKLAGGIREAFDGPTTFIVASALCALNLVLLVSLRPLLLKPTPVPETAPCP